MLHFVQYTSWKKVTEGFVQKKSMSTVPCKITLVKASVLDYNKI